MLLLDLLCSTVGEFLVIYQSIDVSFGRMAEDEDVSMDADNVASASASVRHWFDCVFYFTKHENNETLSV